MHANYILAVEFPDAKITLKVVDEEDTPVELVQASITTQAIDYTKMKFGYIKTKCLTDSSGLFTGSSPSLNNLSFGARKDGYYNSVGSYSFQDNKNGHWEPWNPEIKIILRKIQNPIPMYARDAYMSLPHIEIPATGEEFGFDLVEYDWVAPYGKGKHADFIFRLEKRYVNSQDFDSKLILAFSEKFDGIQTIKDNRKEGSQFKLPRFAPEIGYKNMLTHSKKMIPGSYLEEGFKVEEDFKEDNNYIFRIRSEQKDGKLVRAMYGKIHGDIEFDPRGSKTAVILFKYYLNPDYTRNLEFDPKRNLFKNLKSTEHVEQP